MKENNFILSLKFDETDSVVDGPIIKNKMIRDKTFYSFDSLNILTSISLYALNQQIPYREEMLADKELFSPFFNIFQGDFVIWDIASKLIFQKIDDIIRKEYDQDKLKTPSISSYEAKWIWDNSDIDLFKTLPRFSYYSLLLAQKIISDFRFIDELNSEEKKYINEILRRYRFKAYNQINKNLYDITIPKRKYNAFMDPIVFKKIKQSSPLEITLEFVGLVGSLIALIILVGWTRNYFRHSKIDLRNKEIAQEACEIILKKLKDENIEIRPEAIEKLIENSQLKSIDIPNIIGMKINS